MIDNFIAQVKLEGLARTNRYEVFFNTPKSMKSASTDLRNVLLFCDQIQLPGLNYSTVQNRTFGEFRETPYEKLYDAVNMSFYVDSGLKVKWLFDSWLNSIQDRDSRNFSYYNDYTTDLTITVLDLLDKNRYSVALYECYPKNIGSIQLDQASKDVMKIQVAMQYKYWRSTPIEKIPDGSTVPTDTPAFQQNVAFTGSPFLNPQISNSSVLGNYGVGKLPGQMSKL